MCRLESKYRVVSRLQNQYAHLDIRCVDVRFKTRGAAETLFILLQRMSALELARKTLSVDCHTLFRRSVPVFRLAFRQRAVLCRGQHVYVELPGAAAGGASVGYMTVWRCASRGMRVGGPQRRADAVPRTAGGSELLLLLRRRRRGAAVLIHPSGRPRSHRQRAREAGHLHARQHGRVRIL